MPVFVLQFSQGVQVQLQIDNTGLHVSHGKVFRVYCLCKSAFFKGLPMFHWCLPNVGKVILFNVHAQLANWFDVLNLV